jgi:hypothetical protein
VDIVRLTVFFDGYLEVGHAVDAVLVLLPAMLVKIPRASRRPGVWNLPVISFPLRNGIGHPFAADTVTSILLAAVLPGRYREGSPEERVEVVYLLLGYRKGKRGKAVDLVGGLGELAHDGSRHSCGKSSERLVLQNQTMSRPTNA